MLQHMAEDQHADSLRNQRWQAAPVRSSYTPGLLSSGGEDERQVRTLFKSVALGFGLTLLVLMFLVAARTGSGTRVDATKGDAERIVLASASAGTNLEQWQRVLGVDPNAQIPAASPAAAAAAAAAAAPSAPPTTPTTAATPLSKLRADLVKG
jgi:hypothetical protein